MVFGLLGRVGTSLAFTNKIETFERYKTAHLITFQHFFSNKRKETVDDTVIITRTVEATRSVAGVTPVKNDMRVKEKQ